MDWAEEQPRALGEPEPRPPRRRAPQRPRRQLGRPARPPPPLGPQRRGPRAACRSGPCWPRPTPTGARRPSRTRGSASCCPTGAPCCPVRWPPCSCGGTPWPWPARCSGGTACRRPAGWPSGSATTASRSRDLAGIDTYVASYDDVVADPGRLRDRLGRLAAVPPTRSRPIARRWDVGRAAAAIAPELRHQATRSAGRRQSPALRRAAPTGRPTPRPRRRATARSADVDPGEETPWATALLAARRDATRGHWQAEAARQRFWATRAQVGRGPAPRPPGPGPRASAAAAESDRARDEAAARPGRTGRGPRHADPAHPVDQLAGDQTAAVMGGQGRAVATDGPPARGPRR